MSPQKKIAKGEGCFSKVDKTLTTSGWVVYHPLNGKYLDSWGLFITDIRNAYFASSKTKAQEFANKVKRQCEGNHIYITKVSITINHFDSKAILVK